ncbi:MAG: potassium channel family protein, partial [Planctomycetota bacterium]
AWFGGARFAAEARFDRARFAAEARFDRARFAAVAWFDRARFAAVAWFGDARFAAVAWFGDARFAAVARFDRARFAAVARFDEARFDADAWFGGARFAAVARFDDAIVEGDASFTNARVALLGRLGLHSVRFRRSVSFDNMTIRGHLYLTRSTLDERLTFDGVTFGSRARLGLHRFLPRGGATIELRREHVPGIDDQRRTALHPPTKHKTSLAGRGPARQPAYWCWFIWWWVRYWLGLRRHLPVMNGDDSNDPEQMRLAADDWELLASNYRNQPATDWEEDRARWRAHELRRRIDLIEGTRPFTGHLQPSESLVRHAWAQAWGTVELVFWHVMARWLIQRTLVGYLLQLHRLGVTALLVLLGFALVYKFAIGPDDIGHGNFPPIPIESPEGIVTDYDYSDAHAYWQKDWRNPFYLSITTFVTLGYGDFQPAAGWLKLATALEGLIGVTLLALFTVAWGRKMVR